MMTATMMLTKANITTEVEMEFPGEKRQQRKRNKTNRLLIKKIEFLSLEFERETWSGTMKLLS